jgi:hypothetical protein
MTKCPNANKIPMTNTQANAKTSSVIFVSNTTLFGLLALQFLVFSATFLVAATPRWDLVIGVWDLIGIWALGHWDFRAQTWPPNVRRGRLLTEPKRT